MNFRIVAAALLMTGAMPTFANPIICDPQNPDPPIAPTGFQNLADGQTFNVKGLLTRVIAGANVILSDPCDPVPVPPDPIPECTAKTCP